jgi:AAHS family 3-hydroxyphenylpropionic acid transporter
VRAHAIELVPAVRTGAGVTIALCFAVAVLEGLDIQAMGVAAPRLAAELKLPGGVLGQALSSSNIGLVVGAALGGWLADKIGRKPVLIASVLVFGAFTLGTMYAFNYESLFALRVGAGFGFGGALTNLMAMAAEVSPKNKRGSTGAMMFCGMPLGGGTVALISWLTPTQNWRLLFLIGGLAPLLIAPALALFLPETRDTSNVGSSRAATPRRIWLMTIPIYAVLSLAATFVVPVSFAPWLAIAPTVVLAYAFIHRQSLFSEGRALASVLIWLIFLPTLLILYLVLNWLPSLVSAKGFPMDASLASVWFNYASVLGALLFGYFVDNFGVRWPLAISYAGVIVSLLLLSGAAGISAILIFSGMLGFFLLGANFSLYGAAASYYPRVVRGRGSGGAIAWGRLGSIGGPLIGGYLLAGGASSVVYSMIPFAVVAGVSVLLLSLVANAAD